MGRDGLRRLLEISSRQGVFLLLAATGFLYGFPLLSPWPSLVLYLLGWILIRVGSRRRSYGRACLRAVVWTATIPGALLVILRFGGRFATPAPAGLGEELVSVAPYGLIPALLLVPVVFVLEFWISSHRSGRILYAPIVALITVGALWTQAEFRTDLLQHPWQYAAYAALLLVLLVIHQHLVPYRDPTMIRIEGEPAGGVARRRGRLLPAVLAGVALVLMGTVYRGWQDQAVTAGGGLLRPTLFRFDFADVISLESEIQMSRDLVMLYREDQPPPDRLLRRYVMSGYEPRRGFFRLDSGDEPSPAPPLVVEQAQSELADRRLVSDASAGSGAAVMQEFYIVNFDPQAFFSVTEPEEVFLWKQPPQTTFNNSYAVRSRRPDVTDLENVPWPRDLPDSWRKVYLNSPVAPAISDLAREITRGTEGYYATVEALERYLLEEYYYSLSPGDALDGDQLTHFLFTSRKGYCSYFAFSMALMARSLGIPSRVAAGFFVAPGTGMLGFHPVRGDMAHAWVEVYFPGVGWVEFDPTSPTPAPGEQFSVDYRIDREQLAQLVQEILSSPDQSARGKAAEGAGLAPVRNPLRWVLQALSRWWYLVLGLLGAGAALRRWNRWRRLDRDDPVRASILLFSRAREIMNRGDGASTTGVPLRATPSPLNEAGRLLERIRFRSGSSAGLQRKLRETCHVAVSRRCRELVARRRFLTAIDLRLRTLIPPRVPLVLLVVFLGLWTGLWSGSIRAEVPPPSPGDALEDQIHRMIDAENYERALTSLAQARRDYPADGRFPRIEGDLYFGQELYEPALEAYREALDRGAPEYSTRYVLARTLARLNRDDQAILELEHLHREWPRDTVVVGDLAWLYFKRHRLQTAREILEAALAQPVEPADPVPSDRDLRMTLATVYAGLWDYESAREAYGRAIEQAHRDDDQVFLAVAYYNLSILHTTFHRWEEALSTAERSLAARDRSSGYMIRAELHQRRLDMERSARDYHRADARDDTTPMPGLSLAMLWTATGYPERAIQRMERILDRENTNWIYSFGTDPERYRLRVYGTLAESWEAIARRDLLFRPGSMLERAVGTLQGLGRRIIGWYYRGLYRLQSRRVASALAREGQILPAARYRMSALDHRPALALRHAETAAALETEVNPDAAVDYRLFAARMRRDRDTLTALVGELDSPWRRVDRAEALREQYRLSGHRRNAGLQAAAQLYALAPGGFLVRGLRVPVAVHSAENLPLSARALRRRLNRLGFRVVPNSPLHLELEFSGAGVLKYRIRSVQIGGVLREGEVRSGGGNRDGAFLAALEEAARILTTEPLPDPIAPEEGAGYQ